METVQFNPKISLDFQDILKGLSKLPVTDLEQLVGQLNQVIEDRKKLTSEEQANELIQKIKHGGPGQDFHDRLRQLATASVREEITAAERKELLELVPIAENWAVERLGYLIELSKIWKVSTDEVMEKLDIKTPEAIHA